MVQVDGVATWLNVVLTTQQRYGTGEPGKVQRRDRVGIVEGPTGTGPAQ